MVSRFFHWTCDFCHTTKESPNYGLPDGWIYLKPILFKRIEVEHACAHCRNKFSRDEWGTECKAKFPIL